MFPIGTPNALTTPNFIKRQVSGADLPGLAEYSLGDGI